VIEAPSTKRGVSFETGLVDRILQDVEQEPGNLPVSAGCNPFIDGSRACNFKTRYARYSEIKLAIGLDKVSLLSELSTQIRRDDHRVLAVLDVRTGQAVGPIGLLLGFAPHLHPENGICATGWARTFFFAAQDTDAGVNVLVDVGI